MPEQKLNKTELVKRIQARTNSKNRQVVGDIVNSLLEEIGSALVSGEQVDLPGFGSFSRKLRSARNGRNPQTGEPIAIPAKWVPNFKAGKDLRDRIADCELTPPATPAPDTAD